MPESVPATVAVTAAFMRDGHEVMRALVRDLPPTTLDWRPAAPDTNSVAALLTHALDAERHLTAEVAGLKLPRDREAAFRVFGLGGTELLALVDEVEGDVERHLALVTAERLETAIARPARTATGAYWLIHVAAHTREHLGQASLTLQLAAQAGAAAPRA